MRQCFERGRASAPCIVFFDELDALAPKRGGEGNVATERVVNQARASVFFLEARGTCLRARASSKWPARMWRQLDGAGAEAGAARAMPPLHRVVTPKHRDLKISVNCL